MTVAKIPARDPNSTPNPIFVKCLRAGLLRLWDGVEQSQDKNEFICNTLSLEGCRELRTLILSRLGSLSYRTWVKYQYDVDRLPTEDVQNGRKAWMLDLIEEFS